MENIKKSNNPSQFHSAPGTTNREVVRYVHRTCARRLIQEAMEVTHAVQELAWSLGEAGARSNSSGSEEFVVATARAVLCFKGSLLLYVS